MKPATSELERFSARVILGPTPDHCWGWTCRGRRGAYGKMLNRGRPDSAHRVAYELWRGQIPPGKLVLHFCDNPPCCNPRHLFLGTAFENTHDMLAKGRHAVQRGTDGATRAATSRRSRGIGNPTAKLTEDDVRSIRDMASSGLRSHEIAPWFGVSSSCIRSIVGRRIWRHVA